jgi:hypothetical protein
MRTCCEMPISCCVASVVGRPADSRWTARLLKIVSAKGEASAPPQVTDDQRHALIAPLCLAVLYDVGWSVSSLALDFMPRV